MTNIEIETIQGTRAAFPKMYMGTAVGGYRFAIAYDNHVLEMRLATGDRDPRTGLIIVSRQVPDAKQHDIADERMVEELERAGVCFKNRPRVIAAS